MSVLTIFFCILCVFTIIFFIYVQWSYLYWHRKGLPYIKPFFPFGSFILGHKTKHIVVFMTEEYLKHKSKLIVGAFIMLQPVIMIYDFDLIKRLMCKDFNYFRDRGAYMNSRDDPLSGHVFNLDGEKWKILREKLTSVFTTGKMKLMMPIMKEIGEKLVTAIQEDSKIDRSINMKEYSGHYTTDVIGSCVFGIECNSFKSPQGEFREAGRKMLNINPLKLIFTFTCQKLSKALRMQIFSKKISDFFERIVTETVEYREKNHVQKNDFMDLMIKIRNKEKSNNTKDDEIEGLSMKEIIAQSFAFFLAGFDSSSSNMAFTCFEFAVNPKIQEKARNHIQDVLKRHDNNFTYEALQEMNYLEACINESLRKYPSAPFGFRKCSKDYKISEADFTIKRGTTIFYPIYAYHYDPDIFEDPEKFIPDRFLQENGALKTPYGYLAFADGPRICIGMRLALIQAKIGIALLLLNFKFTVSKKTVIPLKFNTMVGYLQPVDLFLDVEKL